MKSFRQRRAGSAGRRRPVQLRSSQDGSFPVPVTTISDPQRSNVRRICACTASSPSTHEYEYELPQHRNTALITTARENTFNQTSLTRTKDLTCIVRQIQKLSCVTPMKCNKNRGEQRVNDGTEDRHSCSDKQDGSYRDFFDGDFFSYTNPRALSPVDVPNVNKPSSSRSSEFVRSDLGIAPISRQKVYPSSLKSSQPVKGSNVPRELNETTSTGSFSQDDDYPYFKYLTNEGLRHHRNASSNEESATGHTESSSTDGLDSLEKSKGGGTETTASDTTLTLSRGRSNSLDNQRIIKVPTRRLLDSSLANKDCDFDDPFTDNKFASDLMSEANSNAEIDPFPAFDDVISRRNHPTRTGNAMEPAAPFNRCSPTTGPLSASFSGNCRSSVHSPRAPGKSRIDGRANNSIPRTINFDRNDASLDVRSSIDENEIDNPDNMQFTYSPSVSFDYQQQIIVSDEPKRRPKELYSPDRASGDCLFWDDSGYRRKENKKEKESSHLLLPESLDDESINDEERGIQEIIADLKRLEAEEWISADDLPARVPAEMETDNNILAYRKLDGVGAWKSTKIDGPTKQRATSSPIPRVQYKRSHSLPHFEESLQKPCQNIFDSDDINSNGHQSCPISPPQQSSRRRSLSSTFHLSSSQLPTPDNTRLDHQIFNEENLLEILDPPVIRKLATAQSDASFPSQVQRLKSRKTSRSASLVDIFESTGRKDEMESCFQEDLIANDQRLQHRTERKVYREESDASRRLRAPAPAVSDEAEFRTWRGTGGNNRLSLSALNMEAETLNSRKGFFWRSHPQIDQCRK